MEELRVRSGREELKVKGTPETIQREREAFYQHIKEVAEVDANAMAELVEQMRTASLAVKRGQEKKWHEPETLSNGPVTVNKVRSFSSKWGDIAMNIKEGTDGFHMGDSIEETLKNGEKVEFVVTDVTGGYVRFESRDCVGGKEVPWNENGKNAGGFSKSDVFKYLTEDVWDLLPDELRGVISETERKQLVDGETELFKCKLFLPTASEVFDEDNCYGDEGLYEQMEYYKDRRHRMRGTVKGEDTDCWWLSSVRSGYSTIACHVGHYGYARYWGASNAHRVPVCFLIKKS